MENCTFHLNLSYYLCKHRFSVLSDHGALITVHCDGGVVVRFFWVLEDVIQVCHTSFKDSAKITRNEGPSNRCWRKYKARLSKCYQFGLQKIIYQNNIHFAANLILLLIPEIQIRNRLCAAHYGLGSFSTEDVTSSHKKSCLSFRSFWDSCVFCKLDALPKRQLSKSRLKTWVFY